MSFQIKFEGERLISIPAKFADDCLDRFPADEAYICEVEKAGKSVWRLRVNDWALRFIHDDSEYYASGWLVEEMGAEYRPLQESARRALKRVRDFAASIGYAQAIGGK